MPDDVEEPDDDLVMGTNGLEVPHEPPVDGAGFDPKLVFLAGVATGDEDEPNNADDEDASDWNCEDGEDGFWYDEYGNCYDEQGTYFTFFADTWVEADENGEPWWKSQYEAEADAFYPIYHQSGTAMVDPEQDVYEDEEWEEDAGSEHSLDSSEAADEQATETFVAGLKAKKGVRKRSFKPRGFTSGTKGMYQPMRQGKCNDLQ